MYAACHNVVYLIDFLDNLEIMLKLINQSLPHNSQTWPFSQSSKKNQTCRETGAKATVLKEKAGVH
jgi:hypothetical protein